jgi:hypothetical protein
MDLVRRFEESLTDKTEHDYEMNQAKVKEYVKEAVIMIKERQLGLRK